MEIFVYLMAFTTVALVVAGVGTMIAGRDPVARRMLAGGVDGPQPETQSLKLRKENRRLDRLLEPFQERLRKQDGDGVGLIEKSDIMKSAGFYSPRAGTVLYAIRFTLAIAVSTAVASALLLTGRDSSPLVMMIAVVGAGAVAYYLPYIFVLQRAKERQLRFSEGLPDALDLILICLESGLTFPASLQYIAREFRDVHPVIAENFEIVNLEFRAGRRRADALKNLARRVDLVELTSIVNMVNQSEVLGTSLTRAIRTAASDLRRDRMLKAEEKANALPAKMSLVLTACIFPMMFGIILIPVLLRFMATF